MHRIFAFQVGMALAILTIFFVPLSARAHCDTMDGPVVIEAKAALETGDVTPLLKWVKPEAESELRAAFDHTLQVRKLGPEAKELADRYFFETLIRVHRAGEGAPYTGLKPSGQQEPIIVATDKALENGSAEEVIRHVNASVQEGIQHRFERALETKAHAKESVEAGREYVEAYVTYLHYVEGIYNAAAAAGGHDHVTDNSGAEPHQD